MKHFRICGIQEIHDHLNWATHVVSIWSPGGRGELPHFPQAEKRICRVDFDDIIEREGLATLSGSMMIPPAAGDVSRVIQFTRKLPDDAKVLFHCQAGVSRSAACAFLALCQKYPEESPCRLIMKLWIKRRQAYPNSLIIEYGDALLKRDGELIKVAHWFQMNRMQRMIGGKAP